MLLCRETEITDIACVQGDARSSTEMRCADGETFGVACQQCYLNPGIEMGIGMNDRF